MCLGLGHAQEGGLPREAPLTALWPRLRRHSGLLSALGLALADVVHEAQEPCSLPYVPETFMQLDQRLSRLEEQCIDALRAQGFPRWVLGAGLGWAQGLQHPRCPLACSAPGFPDGAGPLRAVLREEGTTRLEEVGQVSSQGACVRVPPVHPRRSQIHTESFLHLRYQGTDCALMVSAHQHPATARSPRAGDFGAAFVERYTSSRPGSAGGSLQARPPGPDRSLGPAGAGTCGSLASSSRSGPWWWTTCG